MRENEQALKDDIAFLRALSEGGSSGTSREGAMLVAAGVIFALVAAQYWTIEAGLLHASPAVRAWLWLDGAVPFALCAAVISARFRDRSPTAVSRALKAAWTGMGVAFLIADLGLMAASQQLGLPLLTKWLFPLVLFTLAGAAWAVAFAVRRRTHLGLFAAASFVTAMLCGAVVGRPEEWLVLSAGLLLLFALPGVMILRIALRRR